MPNSLLISVHNWTLGSYSNPSAAYMRQWTGSAINNGLSPVRRQAITWTNATILSIGLLGTNFSEIRIGILSFQFKKIHFKLSSATMAAILCRGHVMTILSIWQNGGSRDHIHAALVPHNWMSSLWNTISALQWVHNIFSILPGASVIYTTTINHKTFDNSEWNICLYIVCNQFSFRDINVLLQLYKHAHGCIHKYISWFWLSYL